MFVLLVVGCGFFFFFKQKTAYEIKECDWSSDVCSSDLFMHKPEIAVWRGGEFLEQLPAGQRKIAQQRRYAMNVRGIGRAHELDPPTKQIRIEARLDVKRRGRIPHPFERELHHPGRGERNKMAGHDHPRIAKRTPVPLRRIPLNHRHLKPPAGAIICRAHPNHPAADDDDAFAHSSESLSAAPDLWVSTFAFI